jgi:hypothetical protein
MSENPTPMTPIGGGDPRAAVSGPAIFLLVVGGIGVAWQLLMLVLNILGTGLNVMGGGRGSGFAMMQGGVGIVFNIIGLCVGGLIIFGALKMKNLQSYGLAMTASVIAMIPCVSPCCLIGLPAGIWALIVLLKPEVKAAFSAGGGTGGFPTV